MSAENHTIRAVSRAFQVLQIINRLPNPTIMEIKVESGLPYPTVYRIIQTLVHDGLIESEPARKRYRPTELVLGLATGFQQDDQLIKIARPLMVDLTKIFGWPISLAVRVGGRMMVKDSTHLLTTQTFANYYPGYTLPLHDCASGKAYFAFCSDNEREIIQQNSTYENEEDSQLGYARMLLAQKFVVEGIRADGYATHARNLHSDTPGKTSSIAVPIVAGDRLMGCLTVIFFTAAMPMEHAASQYAAQLSTTASEISECYLAAKNSQNEYIPVG